MFQRPVVQMTKANVEEEKLKPFVVMPDTIQTAFSQWWESIPSDQAVDVRYPQQKHGLSGQASNNAKTGTKISLILSIITHNSQMGGD